MAPVSHEFLKQLVFFPYPPSKLFRSPLLRAVHCCRVYGIAYSPPRLSETKGFSSDGGRVLLENAIITKTLFLGATCVAGLEMGGKIFRKI
jgi:hypothetical protein